MRTRAESMKVPHIAASVKDRAIDMAALASLCALAWSYLLYMGWGMAHMDVGAAMAFMPRMTSWQLPDLGLVFAMWAIMMVAMMLPSAAPMLLLFAALSRQLQRARPRTHWCAFVGGYVAVWSAFSVVMTLLQWGLLEARLVSPMMETSGKWLGGVLLLMAGLFQFTSFKLACLANCRSPLSFLVAEWRASLSGAWIMGVRHGLFCLGCCWSVMLLLFVLGVMNVVWIAVLASFVLLEKTLPNPRWFSRAAGLAFIGWGVALL
jgi:predicted metal-binding membrane protein